MIPTPWHWQFPPIAEPPSFLDQLLKVREELGEVMDAYFNMEPSERIAEELMDLDSAVEQALRRVEECGVDLDAVKRDVIEKNDGRGYYGEATTNEWGVLGYEKINYCPMCGRDLRGGDDG